MSKRLPIGISDFKEIIEEEYLYVDKTLFIEELINQGSKVALIPRHRRFGKTLNLSILKQIEERKYAQELIERGIKSMLFLGFGFSGKDVLIRSKRFE